VLYAILWQKAGMEAQLKTTNVIRDNMKRFWEKPKNLFLIDGAGALLTAFFLSVVLRKFNEYFGMPLAVLNFLSVTAVIFCLYSFTCYFLNNKNWQPFLKAISIANLLYCCLTLALVIYYYPVLTILGVLYFLAEILIVSGLAVVELKAISQSYKEINAMK
jgi:hypothetical protein